MLLKWMQSTIHDKNGIYMIAIINWVAYAYDNAGCLAKRINISFGKIVSRLFIKTRILDKIQAARINIYLKELLCTESTQ